MRKKAKRRTRQDSDSPWKELLVKHFERCVFYFLPDIHALINWPKGYEFLDKELRSISRRAVSGKRCVDILVKVHLKDGTDRHILIHVEVQSRRDPKFPQRMHVYHYRAYDLGQVPVISLAILADLDPDWRPDQFGYEHAGKGVHFCFHVCKQIDFRAREEELRTSKDPFARVILAILRTLDTVDKPVLRKHWKLDFMKELRLSGLRQKYVDSLLEALDWFMQLPDTLEQELELDLQRFEEEGHMRRVPLMERVGIRIGKEIGLKAVRTSVFIVLDERFGSVPESICDTINRIDDVNKLTALLKRSLKVNSLEKLLPKQPVR